MCIEQLLEEPPSQAEKADTQEVAGLPAEGRDKGDREERDAERVNGNASTVLICDPGNKAVEVLRAVGDLQAAFLKDELGDPDVVRLVANREDLLREDEEERDERGGEDSEVVPGAGLPEIEKTQGPALRCGEPLALNQEAHDRRVPESDSSSASGVVTGRSQA